MLRVLLCKAKAINHNFCDLLPLLQLACSSTFVNKLALPCYSHSYFCIPTQTILATYIISISIHWGQVQSLQQAPLPTPLLLLSSLFPWFHIFSAFFSLFQKEGKASSVFYSTVVSMPNFLIYSMTNKDVKFILNKLFHKQKLHV